MNTKNTIGAALGLAVAAALGLSRTATSGTIDAVSGSSIKVTGGTTTTTGATINFTFGRSGGTRRCYFDVADHTSASAFPKFATTSGNSFNLSGLAAGTKYFYWIEISQRGERTGNLHSAGTVFSTTATTGVLGRIPESARQATYVDPMGRSIGRQAGFAPVRIDPEGAGVRVAPTAP